MQGQLFIGLSFFLLGAVACGQRDASPLGGELGEGLVVSPGVTVNSASYVLIGPNGFTSAGAVAVGDSPDVVVTVSQLPVGEGYELRVSGTASDGVTVCDGTATFAVTDANATLALTAHLECAVPAGTIAFEASVNVCPVLDELTASPLNLKVGGVASLSTAAHDSDNGPAPLAYSWAANGLRLNGQTAPALRFACSSLGDVTVAATVSDGACKDILSVKVSCE